MRILTLPLLTEIPSSFLHHQRQHTFIHHLKGSWHIVISLENRILGILVERSLGIILLHEDVFSRYLFISCIWTQLLVLYQNLFISHSPSSLQLRLLHLVSPPLVLFPSYTLQLSYFPQLELILLLYLIIIVRDISSVLLLWISVLVFLLWIWVFGLLE